MCGKRIHVFDATALHGSDNKVQSSSHGQTLTRRNGKVKRDSFSPVCLLGALLRNELQERSDEGSIRN
jgi:hypothetical protein